MMKLGSTAALNFAALLLRALCSLEGGRSIDEKTAVVVRIGGSFLGVSDIFHVYS